MSNKPPINPSPKSRAKRYLTTIQSFEDLAQIECDIRFAYEFEIAQKASGLRLSTFRAMFNSYVSEVQP